MDITREIAEVRQDGLLQTGAKLVRNQLFIQGGPGSGHKGHKGRPGMVGGSSSDDNMSIASEDEAPVLEPGQYYHGTNAKAAESILKTGIDPKRARVGTASATDNKSEALFHGGRHASGEHGSAMAPWEEDAVLVVVDYPLQEGFDPGEYSTREKIPVKNIVRLEYYKQVDYKKYKGMAVPYKVVNNPKWKVKRNWLFHFGGPGSGFHGHSGRPGLIGGSSSDRSGVLADLHSRSSEKLYVLDSDGNILLEQEGDLGSVDVPAFHVDNVNLVHNHPDGSSVSIGDLRFAATNDRVGKITVVTRGNVQTVSILDHHRLFVEAGKASAEINMKMADGAMDGSITHKNKNEFMFRFTDEAVEGMRKSGVISITNKNELFHQGGPGSGHHGHRGRPGFVGGSSDDTFPSTEEERARRRERRRLRKERQKGQGQGEGQSQQTRETRQSHPVVDNVVKRLGYPLDNVYPYKEKGRKFFVNGRECTAGADYNPRTRVIRIFNVDNTSIGQIEGMLAHEVQHDRWNQFKNSMGEEWARELNDEFLFTGSSKWERLKKSDGISKYSKEYWAQANVSGSSWDYDRAVDETLAEIARIQMGPDSARTGDKKTIRPIWASLYRRVRLGTK